MARKPSKLKSGGQGPVAIIEVDDPYGLPTPAHKPYGGPEQKAVVLALRDDPLAAMFAARQIDAAMFAAGRRYQQAHERIEIGRIKAIDLTREHVDGGQIARSSVSDGYSKALADLTAARGALGQDDQYLAEDILVRGCTVIQAAARRSYLTDRGKRSVGDWFRRILMRLAVVYGLAMTGYYRELR